jgi:hypothetical protein
MAGSVQRQKVSVQVTELCLLAKALRAASDPARKPRESPPNKSALYIPSPSERPVMTELVVDLDGEMVNYPALADPSGT